MIPSIEAHVNTKLIGTGSDRTPHPLPHLVLLIPLSPSVLAGERDPV
jgi:hypothetical protein